MMYGDRNQRATGSNEINVTPLIDVSLVLVVVLLLAAPLAFESSIGVNSSPARAKSAHVATDVPTIEITLLADDLVRVNREEVIRADLAVALYPHRDTLAERRVLVDTHPGVTHGAFVEVIDEVKRQGAVDIAVAGR